jgi:acyl-CoA reductase-like NAD-dependent aldehyde dehydrogenase
LERVVVQKDIHDEFVAQVKPQVLALRQGPPLHGQYDVGAMTMVKSVCPVPHQV